MPDNFELIQENRITARKRSLGQGNIFKSVRLSTGGGVLWCHFLLWTALPFSGVLPPASDSSTTRG